VVRPPLRLLRLANPFVRLILRSPARRPLDRSLMLLTYTGPRSGRTFTIPLRYARDPSGTVVALASSPERKRWWRAFRDGDPAGLLVAGRTLAVRGRVLEADEAADALRVYLLRYPRAGRWLGLDQASLRETPNGCAGQVALVGFAPETGSTPT
jgi:hypothetical protein